MFWEHSICRVSIFFFVFESIYIIGFLSMICHLDSKLESRQTVDLW